MIITEQVAGDVAIARLEGRLDAASSAEAERKLRGLASSHGVKLILDLSQVSYVSSMGIRVLQLLLRDVRNQSGAIRLAGVQPLVRGTFDLVGLGPVFSSFDSVEAALLSFR